MKSRPRLLTGLATLLLFAVLTGMTYAQDQNATWDANAAGQPGPAGTSTSNDPPGRVARLEYTSGQVSMQPGGVNDWIAASMNRPLTTSDRVWTDKDSRAELSLGDAFVRMNSETSLTMTNVSDNTVQLELDQGILEISVLHLERGQIYEVDTPNYAFTVMKPGVYRFDVYPNEDQSWVTVRSGSGEATGSGNAVKVNSGQQVRFSSGNSLQHVAEGAPARDGFDDWAQVRDQRLKNSVSARYVSPGVIGAQDLDAYGGWRTVPPYGAVWVPNSVPAGWAPYRFGHWVWIAPWGWTWVDDAPWGFAPFHYGRWVSWGGGWGWAPGPVGYWRPYYAPALVAWVGGGGGFGFSIGFGVGGGYGWFPLGWREPYYPWYGGFHGARLSPTYVRNVNVTNTNITNITNVTNNYYNRNFTNTNYVNRNVAGAVTAAPTHAIATGQPINRFGASVPKAELGHAQLVGRPDVTPTRQAVLGGNTPVTRGVPAATAVNRPVVTRTPPPARTPAFNSAEGSVARGAQQSPNVGHQSANVGQQPNNVGRQSPNVGHNVPRPPATAAGESPNAARRTAEPGTAMSGTANATPMAHPVPHPPTAGYTRSADNANGQPTATPHNVPRPPGGNEGYVRGNSPANNTPRVEAPSAPVRAPSTATPRESAPRESTRPEPKSQDDKSRGQSASYVASPPAGYNSRPAPANVTPSGGGNSYRAGSTYQAAPARSYGSSSPVVASRSYSPAPAYGGRSGSPASPHYAAPQRSAPAAPHYSAPAVAHNSGGGATHSGGSQASSGGGSHGSSGGR